MLNTLARTWVVTLFLILFSAKVFATDPTTTVNHQWNADLSPVTDALTDRNGVLPTSMRNVETSVSNLATDIQSVDTSVNALNEGMDRIFLLVQCTVQMFKDEIWGLNLTQLMVQDRLLIEAGKQVEKITKDQSNTFFDQIYTADALLQGITPLTFLQTGVAASATIASYVDSVQSVKFSDVAKLKSEIDDANSDGEDDAAAGKKQMLDSIMAASYLTSSMFADFYGKFAEVELGEDDSINQSADQQFQAIIDTYFTPPEGCAGSAPQLDCLNNPNAQGLLGQGANTPTVGTPDPVPPLEVKDLDGCMLNDYLLSSRIEKIKDSSNKDVNEPMSAYLLEKKRMEMLVDSSLITEDSGIHAMMRRTNALLGQLVSKVQKTEESAQKSIVMMGMMFNAQNASTLEYLKSSLKSGAVMAEVTSPNGAPQERPESDSDEDTETEDTGGTVDPNDIPLD